MIRFLALTAIMALISAQDDTCVDTPGWKDKSGFGCEYYVSEGICSQGVLYRDGQYDAGEPYNFPILNCCACGKDDQGFYAEPNFTPNRCTHRDENSNREKLVKLCAKADNEAQCTESGENSSWRSQHCQWNVNSYEMQFDESHQEKKMEDSLADEDDKILIKESETSDKEDEASDEEDNDDEDDIDDVSDESATWLKTPNAGYYAVNYYEDQTLLKTKEGSAKNCSDQCLNNDACQSFDYSYNKLKTSFQECKLYSILSSDTELYTGGLSTNVTDHYDLAIKPDYYLEEEVDDPSLDEIETDFAVLTLLIALSVLAIAIGIAFKIKNYREPDAGSGVHQEFSELERNSIAYELKETTDSKLQPQLNTLYTDKKAPLDLEEIEVKKC